MPLALLALILVLAQVISEHRNPTDSGARVLIWIVCAALAVWAFVSLL